MKASEFLTEWQEADLYHATSISRLINIWQTDTLGSQTSKVSNTSTTRNYNYALGYLQGEISPYGGGAIITLDQDLLRRDLGRKRLQPTDWFKGEPPDTADDRFQRRSIAHDTDRFETLLKDKLHPVKKYIKQVQIWLPKKRIPRPLQPGEIGVLRAGDDPDKFYNVELDTEFLSKILSNAQNKSTWDAMLQDPRVKVQQELGHQKKHHNVPVQSYYQYSTRHPMYNPRKDDDS